MGRHFERFRGFEGSRDYPFTQDNLSVLGKISGVLTRGSYSEYFSVDGARRKKNVGNTERHNDIAKSHHSRSGAFDNDGSCCCPCGDGCLLRRQWSAVISQGGERSTQEKKLSYRQPRLFVCIALFLQAGRLCIPAAKLFALLKT